MLDVFTGQKKSNKKQQQEIAAVDITTENKCSFCVGTKCCSYFSQEIDVPSTMRDFDQLLWQISHQGVEIFKDDGDWFLLMNNACTHLQSDGRCGIYETRPFICREYSNDFCEFDEPPEASWDLHFRSYQELDAYAAKRFRTWAKRHEPKVKKSKKKST